MYVKGPIASVPIIYANLYQKVHQVHNVPSEYGPKHLRNAHNKIQSLHN